MMNKANSHYRWLGFELSVLRRLKFSSIVIPFSGKPDLDWYLKFWGKQILTNDICQWAWWCSRALVENQGEMLSEEDLLLILNETSLPRHRLHNPALMRPVDGIQMGEADLIWFDNLWLNIQQIDNEYRRALAFLHSFSVIDYVISFDAETAEFKRPLSDIYISAWRHQRHIINNGQANYSVNRDAHDFIRQARGDLMYVRLPGPEGLANLRNSVAGWRENWVRGAGNKCEEMIANQRGRLGDRVSSKEQYLKLVSNFLTRAKQIPKWAVAHTDDGFISTTEIGEVIKQFRPVEVIYSKDFSDVIGGRKTYIMIA
jgi:adenine-specific DNA methylase